MAIDPKTSDELPEDAGESRPDDEGQLQRRVEAWFLAKGVPIFVAEHRAGDLIPVAFPMLAITFAFELAALPWLRFGDQPAAPDVAVLLNVAAVVAVLALLFPTLALFDALVRPRQRPAPRSSGGTDWRAALKRAKEVARSTVGAAARLAPLGGLVGLLLVQGRVPEEVGWQGLADLAAMFGVLTAVLLVWLAASDTRRPDAVAAGAVLGLALFLAVADPHAQLLEEEFPRRTLAGVASAVLCLYAYIRLRRSQRAQQDDDEPAPPVAWGLIAAALVFAFEAALAPWLAWGSTAHRAVVLGLTVLALYLVVRQAYQRWAPRWASPPIGARIALAAVSFVALPAVLVLLLDESVGDRATTARAIVAANTVTLALLVTSAVLGMHHVADWAWRECWQQIKRTFAYFWSIGASVLLVFVFFTFFTNEIWQIAKLGGAAPFWLFTAAFPVVALVLLLVRIPGEIKERNKFESWADVKSCAGTAGDPSRELLTDARLPRGDVDPSLLELRPGDKLNLGLVLLVKQALRTVLVGALVTGVLLVIGWATISQAVLERWDVLTEDEAGLRWEVIVRVATFLGAFCSFYFVANGMKDATSRAASFADVDTEIRRRLATRVAYLQIFGTDAHSTRPSASLAVRVLLRPSHL